MKEMVKRIIGFNRLRDIKTSIRFMNDKSAKQELIKNEKFKNAYKGKKCFILGNGPSLQSVDLCLLQNEYTFTVNQLPRNPQFKKINTNFHVWADERFFHLDRNKPEDMELLQIMKNVQTNTNKPHVFYKYSARKMVEEFQLQQDMNIYYYEQGSLELPGHLKWDCDFTKLVPGFPTVMQYVICLAIYMGFSEIVLLGCDCSGFITIAETKLGNAENYKYAYKISNNEKKRMEKVQNQTSIRDELSWYVSLFDDYAILNCLCESHGIKLLNATQPSLLESVEKADLLTVLKK